ncbi:hypothetical protein CLOP_g2072 [Closterium sp. NIES-67]|nr:hypothetical protein CLOP_g2072 [Closterium sp. NIES-67]
MASLTALMTANSGLISASRPKSSRLPSLSSPSTSSRSTSTRSLTNPVPPRRRIATANLHRTSFPPWPTVHSMHSPSIRRGSSEWMGPSGLSKPRASSNPALSRISSKNRRNRFSYGSRLPLVAAAAAAAAADDDDDRDTGETGESEGDQMEPVREVGESGTIGEGDGTDEQAAAEVRPAPSQPNQRLTAHLDLGEVQRQLQLSNQRTKENLSYLRSRLHASNEWTAKHLKASNEHTKENLNHLKTRLNASNEWTLKHLREGHQWTSKHLKASNQRTLQQLQHLMHSDLGDSLLHPEYLEHLDLGNLKAKLEASNEMTRERLKQLADSEHLDIGNLKARLEASNAKTRERLKQLADSEHLDIGNLKARLEASNAKTRERLKQLADSEHLDIGNLKARLEASNAKTRARLKRSGRQASHTVHGVADVLSVIGAAAAAASSGAAISGTSTGGETGSASPASAGARDNWAVAAAADARMTVTQGSTNGASSASSAPPKSPPRNPYLSGNFQPVANEVPEELDCAVIGHIPSGLQGRFIRNGPNPQLPPSSPALYHWFDGDGMVHSVNFHPSQANLHPPGKNLQSAQENFQSGQGNAHSSREAIPHPRVGYSRRYIRTTGWQEERAAGRALFGGLQQVGLGASHLLLAAMNLLGLRQQDAPMWNMTKNVSNNHFILHAGRLLSLWEAGLPYLLDPSTLNTTGVHSFDDTWRSGMTAHPKVDPVTNHMIIYGYNLTHKPYLRYGVVDPAGALVHSTDIDLPHPVMMHDFAITEHYSIFLDFPLRFQLDKVIQSHGNAKPFVFDPSKPSRVGVLPRFGSKADIQWFTVEPGFCLHVVNAFEESSSSSSYSPSAHSSSSPHSPPPAIVLRVIRFHAFSALGLGELADDLACDEVARLHEYRLDLQSGTAEEKSLGKVCCDFPSINPNFTGRPHRYAYTARFTAQPGPGTTVPSFNAIMKHDFQQGTYQVHTLPPGRFCGEPVFAPRHHFQSTQFRSDPSQTSGAVGADAVGMGAEEEDDGWVVAHVWDEEEMRSEVIVLDAMHLDREPLARVIMPKRVPYGFHGTFLPN